MTTTRHRYWLAPVVASVVVGAVFGWRSAGSSSSPRARGAATVASVDDTGGGADGVESRPRLARQIEAARPLMRPTGQDLEAPVIRDPTDPDYDAARLFGASWRDARQIFEAEPRLESWASPREAALRERAIDDLRSVDPSVDLDVQCRTESCRVRVCSTRPLLLDKMAPYPFVCQASFAQPDFRVIGGDKPCSDVYLLFGAENAAPESFAANADRTCPNYRDAWLGQAREP